MAVLKTLLSLWSFLSTVTKPFNAALRLLLSLVVCLLETVLSYYPCLLQMNNRQCLTGVSALAFLTSFSPFWCAGGGYPLLTSMQCPNISKMNGKRQGDKLNGVISTGRGKKKNPTVVSKCFCLKGTADCPSPRISSVWMLCCCTQMEKNHPFKIALLWIWVSWFLTGSFNTSLVSLPIPSSY